MKKNVLLLFALLFAASAMAQQQYIISGQVTSVTGGPVAFTSIYVRGATQGTCTNTNGVYQLKLSAGKYQLVFRAIGYSQTIQDVTITNQNSTQNVQLPREAFAPAKNDSAVNIIQHAIDKRQDHLAEADPYACDVYIKGTQKIVSAPKNILSKGVARELQLDTNRQGILYLSEKQSRFEYGGRDKVKETMVSSKAAGNNSMFGIDRAGSLQVNFYKNIFDIQGLNPRGFISPIASNALTYYDYKLLGSTTENGHVIYKIQVTPKRALDPTFSGNIYIVDGEWRVYQAHLYVTGSSTTNLVDTLNIDQQYIPVTETKWQPASITFTFSGNVLGFKFNGYIVGLYSNYNLDPKFGKGYFNGEVVYITDQTATRDSAYWADNRPVPLVPAEAKNYKLKDASLRNQETTQYKDSTERANNKFNPIAYVFFTDSISNYRNRSYITVPPLYETVFYNTVEGWGINLKPTYTKQFYMGNYYSITPNVRYGFSNQLFNANIAANYTYNALQHASVYGGFGTNIFDLSNESSVSQFSNTVSTLLFKSNTLKLYESHYANIGLKHDVARGLLLDGSLEYARRTALVNSSSFSLTNNTFTSNSPITPNSDYPLLFQPNRALTLKLSGTFTFDQQYIASPAGRTDLPSRYPQLKISYRKGIHALGSDVDYDYGEVELLQDRVKVGTYGYTSYMFKAGNFFNTTSLIYPDYKQYNGNQGLVFNPEIGSFHFLPYYTYNSTSYFEGHVEHNFSGSLFNHIPGVRVLKLDEIIGANYLTQPGDNTNYSEFYVGIQRFFLRLDYGVSFHGSSFFEQGIRIYYGL